MAAFTPTPAFQTMLFISQRPKLVATHGRKRVISGMIRYVITNCARTRVLPDLPNLLLIMLHGSMAIPAPNARQWVRLGWRWVSKSNSLGGHHANDVQIRGRVRYFSRTG